jgi:PGF-pre-PGF domain-containing protein
MIFNSGFQIQKQKEMKMNNKKILLSVFFVFAIAAILFLVPAVSAVTGLFTNTTLNGTNISETHLIYVNISECAANCYIGNVSFNWTYYNGTSFRIATVSNTTANQSVFAYSWDTTGFLDSQNGTLNFTSFTFPSNLSTINFTNSTTDINLDNTPPTLVVYGTAPTAYANTTIHTTTSVATANLTLSIYITDATKGMANLTEDGTAVCFVSIGTGINHTIPMFNVGRSNGWCNASNTNASTALNLSGLSDGNSTIRVYVNDSVSANLLNSTPVAHIDTTSPTATATCSPSTVNNGDSFPCLCSGSDATSGVDTSTGSSTSNSITSTSKTGSFTYTCTITDNGGLSASGTAAYSVVQLSLPSSSGGSPGTTTKTVLPVHIFSKIVPEVPSISKYTDPNLGIKEIQIEVNSEAQNVKVSVTKYSGKPAAVTIEKAGKTYQYMQINVDNVAGKLDKATVTSKVEKSWVSSNNLDKEDVSLFKYDETGNRWNELTTSYDSEDDTYYYYTVELDSFSYFALGEKTVVSEETGEEVGVTQERETVAEERNYIWIWIAIIVLVLIAAGFVMNRRRE